MADLGSYDENAAPAQSFEPLPAAPYVCVVTESDVTPTKAGTGDILKLKLLVVEGPYENRVLWDRINIRNNNQTAQEIGQRQLASLRAATGVQSPKASEEFHNIPIVANVKVKPAKGDFDAGNEIKSYAKLSDEAPPAAQQPAAKPAQAPPRQAAPATRPPWQRKTA